ncbi:DNA-binding protein [Vibrio crassostreae]|nr:DNA-binding protein [Vibrio crassostreae]CAK2281214.1 DNA-binding protein [Vibrio crassostreae]CAK2426425.1 DNA-binding protein [Vibrio crassostreae]CAK2689427.1 DNA-binding protein [Vibrio crassostreae]
MDKILIKKHDKCRFLLTEVLPYETPMFYSNVGFYYLTKSEDTLPVYIKDILINDGNETYIPYDFYISKGEDGFRKVSVPHPATQYKMCNLVHDNAELVTYLCSKSNYSIRKPTRVASYYYESNHDFYSNKNHKLLKDHDVEQQQSINEEDYVDDMYTSSYFSYDGYTLLYKFYDSLKFQSLEKKFGCYLRFDIAKCFSSIYTHSISWAIKGKLYSKENAGKHSFDDQFDKCIRNMNDGETNGIIVGPEFSRVFAEIILQKIDVEVEIFLKKKGLINKVDYEVKRYVDDYFVFTKDDQTASIIYNIFTKKLSDYKLFINSSKTKKDRRPFITNLTIAKTDVSDIINDFFKSIKRDKSDLDGIVEKKRVPSITGIYKPYSRSKKLITRFKSIVKSNDATYDAFSGLVLSIFRTKLTDLLNEIKHIKNMKDHSSTYLGFLIFTVDFLSFIYSMNVKVSTSHLMSQIFLLIHEISGRLNKSDSIEVEKKIRDEAKLLIQNVVESGKPRVEFINVIISLRLLYGSSVVRDEWVLNFFGVNFCEQEIDNLDYFELTSLLYLSCLDGSNPHLKDSVYKSLIKRIVSASSPKKSSELMQLFLDLGSFPLVNKLLYKEAISAYLTKIHGNEPSQTKVNQVFNWIHGKRFFVDWRGKANIRTLLHRKAMLVGYDS